jgi:hypothetical protein|eukprot:scaffold996_cov271-Chaetoceros_neogracile.AAC.27
MKFIAPIVILAFIDSYANASLRGKNEDGSSGQQLKQNSVGLLKCTLEGGNFAHKCAVAFNDEDKRCSFCKVKAHGAHDQFGVCVDPTDAKTKLHKNSALSCTNVDESATDEEVGYT